MEKKIMRSEFTYEKEVFLWERKFYDEKKV